MVNCISPKSNKKLPFPQLAVGQKRKNSWPQKNSSSASPSPRPNKRTKFSLKEMADQFTASQVELAARSFMLPRGPDQKNTCKHVPQISDSINIFMKPESCAACAKEEEPVQLQQESSLDLSSWADLDPTPMRETTALGFAEPTPIADPSLIAEPTPIWEAPDIPLFQDTSANSCAPFQLDLPENLQVQGLSSSASPTIEEEHSLLHQTIQLFPTNFDLVKNALELNQKDLRRKSPLPNSASKSKSYGYPLNIAILHDASFEVLELIAKAAPDVITRKDGNDDCGSLSLVLQQFPKNALQVVHLLVKANPMCLRMANGSGNLPLHVALEAGTASLDLVRVLCMLYPPALLQTNSKGESPLAVAQRAKVPDAVLKLVQGVTKNQEQRHGATASSN